MLEIFQHDADHPPKRCGFRCPLSAEDKRDCRGLGELKRLASTINHVAARTRDYRRPTVEEAGKAGFTVYENMGGGKVKRIAGTKGPEGIHIKNV